ncbi:MAG: 50S ribosomal protein L2 [Methanonatronarchaeales archaeon]|nr:50S ribosomal protein L2 [Methanonatronarchaeales archaeon]
MGKRTRSQKLGTGSGVYGADSHRYRAEVHHPPEDSIRGVVVDIEHDPARTAPVARVRYENDEERYILVPEGVSVGQEIECGVEAPVVSGNTLPLAEIPEGTPIYNIEIQPGDGGKVARASGTYGLLIAHDVGETVVQLPSGELKRLNPRCRVTIGVVAGGGRTEKPLLKAGKKHHKVRRRGGKYPKVRGVAMNAVDHPFGGGGKQRPGKPKTVGRNTPPGRKVGSVRARRTGRR